MTKSLYKIPMVITILNIFLLLDMYLYAKLQEGFLENVVEFIYYKTSIKYMQYTGIISLFAIILSIVFIMNKKIPVSIFTVTIVLNVLYLCVYIYWMTIQ